MKFFDYVVGNPPYNSDFRNHGNNNKFAKSIYNFFMDEAFKVSEKVEFIHPARFLFHAGSTPKAWNEKMLNDPHFKILSYEPDSSKVFPKTDISGGITITYRDENKNFGKIGLFIPHAELKTIKNKVTTFPDFESLQKIMYSRATYHFTDIMFENFPEAITMKKKDHLRDMSTNIFLVLPQLFYDTKPNNGEEYIKIFGREGTSRKYKWIRKDFVNNAENLKKYKIFIPKASGSNGKERKDNKPMIIIGHPELGEPMTGHTETFLSIGCFDTRAEAENFLKYIKSKFARAMLSILKVVQHCEKRVWFYVPQQNFTSNSDIDWSKTIHEIDLQLYKKYGLDNKEIKFIESHTKEMA